MQREEAEAEAERRNRDDPKAARFEFYALDESAGLADDAWDVGIRLRPGGSTAPGSSSSPTTPIGRRASTAIRRRRAAA